jgi:CAAX protease family protein
MTHQTINPRNPWLVLLWTFGLFILANTVLYIHYALSAHFTGSGFDALASGSLKTPVTILIQGVVGLVIGVPFIFLITRFLWCRKLSWMGLSGNLRPAIGAALLGLASAGAVIGVLSMSGIARFAEFPPRFPTNTMILILIGQVCWILFKVLLEEVIFRGMVTRELAVRWGWPRAIVVGGLFFAFVHMVGIIPLLTLQLVSTLCVAGVAVNALFVALYIRGRSLWLPVGFHVGWNILLSVIAGTTMSGGASSYGLFRIEMEGHWFLTGGEFGVELSVVAILLYVIIAGMLFRKMNWRPANIFSNRP